MTQPSPADTLRTAAEKLRQLVTDLDDCRGPWYIVNRDQRPYPQTISNIGVPYVVASTTTDPSHPPTMADYIAAMHPGVGTALAQWLETEAATWAGDEAHYRCTPTACTLDAALAVARIILGEEQP